VRSVASTRSVEPVYDITVGGGAHEFFANGVLVHNCTFLPGSTDSPGRIDASVYLALELLPVPASGETSMMGAELLGQTDLLGGLWR